jgi:putative transposase
MMDDPASYPRHRFPAEIISHAVWLHHVFSLSLRDVELILAERGVLVTHESIRLWGLKFGAKFAEDCNDGGLGQGHLALRWSVHPHPGRAALLCVTVDQRGVVLDPMRVDGGRNG